jgi:hypothetical protein
MFTQKENAYIAWALTFCSHLLTNPLVFKAENFVQEERRLKVHLRTLRLGILAFEIFATLSTLPTTISANVMLHIIGHGLYVLIRVGMFSVDVGLLFYGGEVQELINQTLKINFKFGAKFLGRSELPNKKREVFFLFMFYLFISLPAGYNLFGLFLAFLDLPFNVYPGARALRGNVWMLLLMAVVRCWLWLEEAGSTTIFLIGIFFSFTATLFWLKKAW